MLENMNFTPWQLKAVQPEPYHAVQALTWLSSHWIILVINIPEGHLSST